MSSSYVDNNDESMKVWELLAEWDNLDEPLAPLTGNYLN